MQAGTRLGPYEIVAPIGAGGMGEVYKARDTRLDRSVAVKILPAEFAGNAQLKLRFEREAKAISQLTHPNICTLYDVGDGYLVMELLDGEPLDARLSRGPLPMADVLRYGAQIAEALGRAHHAGIVHRDLKPGNIMLTKAGAKLLDFGLAKATSQVVTIDGATQQKELTSEGTLLGTFQYMAPEQLEGEDADARTDIFALGVVLYEMATGARAFSGKTRTSLIASIVSGTPRPISAIQPVAPVAFEHVVGKCLEKDRDARWQNASDVAEELRWIATQPQESVASVRPSRAGWVVAAIVAVLSIASAAFFAMRAPKRQVFYSDINPPAGAAFLFDDGVATISPDGSMIVFPAVGPTSAESLWLRSFGTADAHPLHGTENGTFPFWSPDSKSLGFFADGKLKKIDITGGTIETLADAASGRGGAWTADGTILFAPSPGDPLLRISSAGGTPQAVTTLDLARGDSSHRYPALLGDDRHFIAYVQGSSNGNLLLGSLDSKETRMIGSADGGVVFVPPNILLVVRDRVLRAQHLNTKTWAFEGEAVPLAEGIQASSTYNFVSVSASRNGMLVYVTGASAGRSDFAVFDATGKKLATVGAPTDKLDPRVSPDGMTLVYSNTNANGASNIWAFDFRRNLTSQLTFSQFNEFAPVWSPDGKSIVYTSFDHRPGDLFVKRIDGSGGGEPLFTDRRRKVASDWTRDGKYIIYNVINPKTVWDLEAYSLADHKVLRLINSATSDVQGHVSPDGKWLVYTAMDVGHSEIYVTRFPTTQERWQISGGGGEMPLWSHDGRQIFYVAPDGKLMAAAVHPDGDHFVADAPHAMFATNIRMLTGVTRCQYDVTYDGRFIVDVLASDVHASPVTLVQNWTKKLSPQ